MNSSENRAPREDRRLDDKGPPLGWRERRKRVERRIPKTEEIVVSDEEWEVLFVSPAKTPAPEEHAAATDVFDRAGRK